MIRLRGSESNLWSINNPFLNSPSGKSVRNENNISTCKFLVDSGSIEWDWELGIGEGELLFVLTPNP